MTEWRAAKSLLTLRTQVDELWPGRDHGADGIIGDAAHTAEGTGSDHNPDAKGIVRAEDFDADYLADGDRLVGPKLCALLVAARDTRTKYIIFNGQIMYGTDTWARYFQGAQGRAWAWYPYHGDDPHRNHLHLSVVPTSSADNESKWNLSTGKDWFDMATEAQLRKATDASAAVIIRGDVKGGHPHNLTAMDGKLSVILAMLSKLSPTAAAAVLDPEDLAGAIADSLSDDVAAKVADLLAARLAK